MTIAEPVRQWSSPPASVQLPSPHHVGRQLLFTTPRSLALPPATMGSSQSPVKERPLLSRRSCTPPRSCTLPQDGSIVVPTQSSPPSSTRSLRAHVNVTPRGTEWLRGQKAVHRSQTPPRTRQGSCIGRPLKVLCYGDSNTAGFQPLTGEHRPYGDHLSEALREAGLDVVMTCCGLDGFTAEEMVQHAREEVVTDTFGRIGKGILKLLKDDGIVDLVVLMAGTNDIGKRRNIESIIQDVLKLQQLCWDQGASTLILGPPSNPASKQMSAVRSQLVERLREWPRFFPGIVGFYDSEELVPRQQAFWNTDGIHFSSCGLAELGSRLAPLAFPFLYALSQQKVAPPLTDCLPDTWDTVQQKLQMRGSYEANARHQSPHSLQRASSLNVLPAFALQKDLLHQSSGGLMRQEFRSQSSKALPRMGSYGELPSNVGSHHDLSHLSSRGLMRQEFRSQSSKALPRRASYGELPSNVDSHHDLSRLSSRGLMRQEFRSQSSKAVPHMSSYGELPSNLDSHHDVQRQTSLGMIQWPSNGLLPMAGPQKRLDFSPTRQRHQGNRQGSNRGASSRYVVGDNVEVYSNSLKYWCPARVIQVEDGLVASQLLMPDGSNALKILPLGHHAIRKAIS